jgi:hypothetical protein
MTAKVKNKNYRLWLIAFSFSLVAANTLFSINETATATSRLTTVCSTQSLENLTSQLLQDLPSYANRATQRARRRSRSSDVYSYMLVAGRPEFAPLPLNLDKSTSNTTEVEQVFFTTLERQYIAGKAVESQQFHWLLLTKSNTGWRFVMMFTQIGSYPQKQVVSPPRDSSNGVVAQAIKTWLRDCRAGSMQINTGI